MTETELANFHLSSCIQRDRGLDLRTRALHLAIFATLVKMPRTVPICLVFSCLAMQRGAVWGVSLAIQQYTVILVSVFTAFCTPCLLLVAGQQPTALCTCATILCMPFLSLLLSLNTECNNNFQKQSKDKCLILSSRCRQQCCGSCL